MTSLVSASQVVTGQVQSLDSVRAHALPSDAMIFASGTKVQPANQNLGSYAIVESGVNSLGVTTTGSVPAVTQSPFADVYKEGSIYFNGVAGNYLQNTASYSNGSIQWNTTGMTVEAWVNYPTFTGASTLFTTNPVPTLFGLSQAAGGGTYWAFGSNVSGYVNFYYYNGTYQTVMSTTQLSANTWNHIAMTCSTLGQIFIFVNGVQTTVIANRNGSLITPATNFETVQGTPGVGSYFITTGQFNSVATNAYVADLRLTTGTPVYTGLTGSLATFTVPSAPLSSTTSPGVTQFLLRAGANAPTVQNGALTFDRGLKQFANFGAQTFNIATRGFTAVFRYTWNGTLTGYERIFQATTTTANQNNSLLIARYSGTNSLYGAYYIGGSAITFATSATTISQGTNYVAAFVYNPSTGTGQCWINGAPSGSAVTGLSSSITTDLLTPFTFVGCEFSGAGSFTNATMNTLAVYNRALSNVEIYNSYLALTTSTVNAPIEIGDANGVTAFAVTSDGRVNVTKLGQTSNVVPWPPAAMTGYVTSINGGTYVASASSQNAIYPAWNGFDKALGTYWASADNTYTSAGAYSGTVTTTDVNGTVYYGDWLQIQLASSVAASSYIITPSGTATAPSKFVVLGSRDGVNWTLVDSRSGITNWSTSTPQTFTVSSGQSFSYFRFSINQTASTGTNTVIQDITVYGTADTAQPLTVSQPVTLSYGAQTASLTGISGDKYVPQDFSSSALNVPAYVVSNTATAANTLVYSSFGPFAGEGSLYFGYPPTTTLNQCGAYVNLAPSTAPNFTPVGTPFTIEGWVYVQGSSSDNNYYIFLNHGSPNTGAGTAYDWTSFALNGVFYMGMGAGVSPNSANASGFVYNAWNHVSGCWNGTNTIYASVNGTVGSQVISSGTPTFNSAYSFLVGAQGGAYNMRGYIACARVVRGAALYTSAFTPPTAPLQPIQGTTQAGTPYGTVLLLRNAPAPGRVLTSKFGGANSGGVNGAPLTLAFPPAAMTGYATALSSGYGQGTYVASASSEYPNTGSGQVYALFDKVVTGTNYWQAGGGGGGGGTTYNASSPYNYTGSARTVDVNGTSYAGEWVQVQMPSSVALSNYQIQLYTSGSSGAPSNWSILGSRDGVNWSLVDQRSGIAYTTSLLTFSTSASQAFTYYRMVITQLSSSNTNGVVFAELVFNGTIEGPNVTADGRLGVGVSAPVQALEVAGSAVVAGTLSAGNPLMFRNALYNGDFRIAQRGTSFSLDQYTLDRWWASSHAGSGGTATITQIQSGLANFSNAIQIASTSTTNGNFWLSQSLETRDVVRFQGQPATVSFWYRIPVSFTGTWTANLVWSTAVDTKIINSSVSYTVAGSGNMPNTTAWTYTQFQAFVPSTAQALSVMFYTTNSTVNGATIQITGVQLEKGSVATPFEVRPYATELALCQRYFEKSYSNVVAPGTNTNYGSLWFYGSVDGGGNFAFSQRYSVPKRAIVNPTFYQIGGTSGSWGYTRSGASGTATIVTSENYSNEFAFRVYASAVGGVHVTASIYGHWVTDAEL